MNISELGDKIKGIGKDKVILLVKRNSGEENYVVAKWSDEKKKYSIVFDPNYSSGAISNILEAYGKKSEEKKVQESKPKSIFLYAKKKSQCIRKG